MHVKDLSLNSENRLESPEGTSLSKSIYYWNLELLVSWISGLYAPTTSDQICVRKTSI